MYEDAVGLNLPLQGLDFGLYDAPLCSCAEHIAEGAYRDNKSTDGNDYGQCHPKDVDVSLSLLILLGLGLLGHN